MEDKKQHVGFIGSRSGKSLIAEHLAEKLKNRNDITIVNVVPDNNPLNYKLDGIEEVEMDRGLIITTAGMEQEPKQIKREDTKTYAYNSYITEGMELSYSNPIIKNKGQKKIRNNKQTNFIKAKKKRK